MSKSILVVDDSKAIRQSLQFVLEQSGYTVAAAVDGIDGLDKVGSQEFDLIITDINMPNLDGIGFIKRVREMDKAKFVPIIVLTTESQSSIMEEGKKSGATGWIVKPFSNDKLIETVKKVIG